MGNNNRWAREGGVIDEILVENLYRNPEGNPLILDTILLEKVVERTEHHACCSTPPSTTSKSPTADTIRSVARVLQPELRRVYHVEAPLFCDASGDGIVGFLAGAAFRMGAEAPDEFGEAFAPGEGYGELLGHSHLFLLARTRPAGHASCPQLRAQGHHEDPALPRFQRVANPAAASGGSNTAAGSTPSTTPKTIKWELWRVVYGVWDYIKNSGEFPEADNLTLEWVGHDPRQAREPPLRRRLHAHPAGRRRTATARGRRVVRRLVDRSASRRRRLQRLCPAATNGTPRASTRSPTAASTAATSATCSWPAGSSAPPTWPSVRRASWRPAATAPRPWAWRRRSAGISELLPRESASCPACRRCSAICCSAGQYIPKVALEDAGISRAGRRPFFQSVVLRDLPADGKTAPAGHFPRHVASRAGRSPDHGRLFWWMRREAPRLEVEVRGCSV